MDSLLWLTNWFTSHCDGDWEHENQIKIYTVDNPGWVIRVDLRYTAIENLTIDYVLVEDSETDWYGFSIKDKYFDGGGDLTKLPKLIEIFKKIVLDHELKTKS
jgi:hypothetical protein